MSHRINAVGLNRGHRAATMGIISEASEEALAVLPRPAKHDSLTPNNATYLAVQISMSTEIDDTVITLFDGPAFRSFRRHPES